MSRICSWGSMSSSSFSGRGLFFAAAAAAGTTRLFLPKLWRGLYAGYQVLLELRQSGIEKRTAKNAKQAPRRFMCYTALEFKFLGSEVIVPRIRSRGIFLCTKEVQKNEDIRRKPQLLNQRPGHPHGFQPVRNGGFSRRHNGSWNRQVEGIRLRRDEC